MCSLFLFLAFLFFVKRRVYIRDVMGYILDKGQDIDNIIIHSHLDDTKQIHTCTQGHFSGFNYLKNSTTLKTSCFGIYSVCDHVDDYP